MKTKDEIKIIDKENQSKADKYGYGHQVKYGATGYKHKISNYTGNEYCFISRLEHLSKKNKPNPNQIKKMNTKEKIKWARLFHETYERLASSFGYETREDTKEFDPESKNGKLMLEVCSIVLSFQKQEMVEEIEKRMSSSDAVWKYLIELKQPLIN